MTSTSTSTPAPRLLARLGGLLLIVLGLAAAAVTTYLVPWGVGGGRALFGYQVIGYVNAHTYEFTGTPSPALYYLSMGTFVFLGTATLLSLTTGTRSLAGRLVAASFALLAVPLLGLAVWGLFVSAGGSEEYDYVLVGWIMAVVLVVVLADVVTLYAGAVRAHDLAALVFLLAAAALHAYTLSSLRISAGSDFDLRSAAWLPTAGYLLAAAGVAAVLRSRKPTSHGGR